MSLIAYLIVSFIISGDHSAPKGCEFSTPDTAVAGIILRDVESSVRVIGKNYKLDDNEQLHYQSDDGREKITIQFLPGDYFNQFSEFEVTLLSKPSKLKKLSVDHFETSSGIRLGLTKTDIIQKLGTCFKSRMKKDVETIRYEIND